MSDVQQPANPRTQLAVQLNYLQGWLRHVEALTHQRSAVVQRYQQYLPFKRKWGILAFLLWGVGAEIAVTAIASPLLQADIDAQAKAARSIAVPQVDPQIVAQLAVPVALVIAILAVIIYNKAILPKRQKKVVVVNEARQAHNNVVAADEQAINARLGQASQDYSRHVGDTFPQSYLYDQAVAFFAQMVHNHRASTIQDAVNLFETQLHRDRLENLAAANLAEARRANALIAVGNVINAMGHAATVNAVLAQGAATRSAAAANAARVTEQLKKPRTVFINRR